MSAMAFTLMPGCTPEELKSFSQLAPAAPLGTVLFIRLNAVGTGGGKAFAHQYVPRAFLPQAGYVEQISALRSIRKEKDRSSR